MIYLKRYDLKNVKQVLRRPMTLLVTLYCLTIGLSYDRAVFTYKSLRNHVQKIVCVFLTGVRTHPTHLWPYLHQVHLESGAAAPGKSLVCAKNCVLIVIAYRGC